MWTDRDKKIAQLGCICCRKLGYKTAPEIHHIVEAQRRLGPDFSLPLCAYHHRGIKPLPEFGKMSLGLTQNIFGVSRHGHGKAKFEERWGKEKDLLKEVNTLEQEVVSTA